VHFVIDSLNITKNQTHHQINGYDSETIDYLDGDLKVTIFNFPFNNQKFVHLDQEFSINYISKELQDELLTLINKIEKEINEH
jgi:hypothetical protein